MCVLGGGDLGAQGDRAVSSLPVLSQAAYSQACWAQGCRVVVTQGRSTLWVFSNCLLARGLSALVLYHAAWVLMTLPPQ